MFALSSMRLAELVPFLQSKISLSSSLPFPVSFGRRKVSLQCGRVLIAVTTLGTVVLYLSWQHRNLAPEWMGMKTGPPSNEAQAMMKDVPLGSTVKAVRSGAKDDRPYWQDLREHDKHLPQHNFSLPYPEGRTGRYLHFDQTWKGMGWGNILNDM
jgi:hypothetical protein